MLSATLSEKLDDLDIELCCAPNRNTTFFLECENQFPVSLSNQQGDDLGERMAFSFSLALQTNDKVIIIGTDCPTIDKNYIEQAIDALDSVDVVIGPAADGGYVLLGLRKFSLELFSGFNWGSNTVLDQTRQVLNGLNWSFEELAIMHDIDRPEDLYRHKELLHAII
jgi:rSAM/selenodomain-associated transferase 1